MNLDDIIAQAPEYGDQKWSFFGKSCLFWTTDLRDLKRISDFKSVPLDDEKCCPFCGGTVEQLELNEFVKNSKSNEILNEFGYELLAKAHASNVRTCRIRWDRYKVKIKCESS